MGSCSEAPPQEFSAIRPEEYLALLQNATCSFQVGLVCSLALSRVKPSHRALRLTIRSRPKETDRKHRGMIANPAPDSDYKNLAL